MTHLLVALSAHGYGHAAQTAPVVNALRARLPDLKLTLRTALPRAFLETRFEGAFELIAAADDFGMVMDSALDIALAASARRYAEWHADWEGRVARTAAELAQLAPDLVLANVPYLTLAAARVAGIPAAALCSLNWIAIYRHYFGDRPEAGRILDHMLGAYRGAAAFLQPEPGMPMEDLPNRMPIGPLARSGVNRRAELERRLGLSQGTRLVLVALGGIELRLDMDSWPRIPGIYWFAPASLGASRAEVSAIEALGLHFTDLLRSCDAVVGKPGYGTFTEAAVNGVPVLYVCRGDWPEEPYLIRWLQRHGRCLEIERSALERGLLGGALEALWRLPAVSPPPPSGVAQAADYLTRLLAPEALAQPAHDRIPAT